MVKKTLKATVAIVSIAMTSVAMAGYAFVKEKDGSVAKTMVSHYLSMEFPSKSEEISYLDRSKRLADAYVSENTIAPKVAAVRDAYSAKAKKLRNSFFKEALWTHPNYGFVYVSRSEWKADESLTDPSKFLASCPSGNCWWGKESNRTKAIMRNYDANYKAQDESEGIVKHDTKGAEFSYHPMRRIILHHTAGATPSGIEAEKKEMRQTYSTHAVKFGWGDIGYHFVIGPSGTVYEWRKGGAFIDWFHAVWHNQGMIGISLMGDGSRPYPEAQLSALKIVVAKLAQYYAIDVEGTTLQRSATLDKTTWGDAVIAHKEIDSWKPTDPAINMDEFRKGLR